MTPAETILWEKLRGRRLNGYKFRRQHPLGQFIADFCCSSARLIVELDGAVHDAQQEYDHERTLQFESFGYRVIRFNNDEVIRNLDQVLERIANACSPFPP